MGSGITRRASPETRPHGGRWVELVGPVVSVGLVVIVVVMGPVVLGVGEVGLVEPVAVGVPGAQTVGNHLYLPVPGLDVWVLNACTVAELPVLHASVLNILKQILKFKIILKTNQIQKQNCFAFYGHNTH
jgi:hypothetical protein